jgi:hypothetical protein
VPLLLRHGTKVYTVSSNKPVPTVPGIQTRDVERSSVGLLTQNITTTIIKYCVVPIFSTECNQVASQNEFNYIIPTCLHNFDHLEI